MFLLPIQPSMTMLVCLLLTSLQLTDSMPDAEELEQTMNTTNAVVKSFYDMRLKWQPSEVVEMMEEKKLPHFGFARIPSRSSVKVSKAAKALEMVTADLKKESGRIKRSTLEDLKAEFGSPFQREVNAVLTETKANDEGKDPDGCPEEPRNCLGEDLRFRTLTGRCNRLDFPEVGAALQPLWRLLPARYADGVSKPRTLSSADGTMLPSAREVSLALHQESDFEMDNEHSHIVMQWGQFVDHDLTGSPQHRAANGKTLDDVCRPCNSASINEACLPIAKPGEASCLPFVRSLPGQKVLGARQQINQVFSSTFYSVPHLILYTGCPKR